MAKLVSAGYRVAIAEQTGSEPPRGEKLVPRFVRRVVTPGTVVEPELLSDRRNNYLAALVVAGERAGLAYADITTGEFAATEIAGAPDMLQRVLEELARLAPAELLCASGEPGRGSPGDEEQEWVALLAKLARAYHVTPYPVWHFDAETASQALRAHFHVATLEGYGLGGRTLAVQSAGVLLQYATETQHSMVQQLSSLRTYAISEFMTLDEVTRRNLELTEAMRGGTDGSLLHVLDATLTPMGNRLLRRRLGQPLVDSGALRKRLLAVTAWHDDAAGVSQVAAGAARPG